MGRGPRGLRGDNSIFAAAIDGSLGAVRHILRTVPGAAAAMNEFYYTTALHVAAREGHAEICRVLLAAGVEPDTRTRDGLLAKDCGAAVPGETFLLGGEKPWMIWDLDVRLL